MDQRAAAWRRRAPAERPGRHRALLGACLAHLVHDGFTDLIYVLLPVWQRSFGLDYAALALLRCLYYGTMGALQVPADRWTRRCGGRLVLGGATAVAAAGYLLTSAGSGLAPLCAGLVLAGLGSSVQHPRASVVVTEAFGDAARRPLGLYNFAGDLGKSAFPSAVALLLLSLPWRGATALVGAVGFAAALAVAALLPRTAVGAPDPVPRSAGARSARPFRLLMLAGVLDTATRMGFLLFLPFILRGKGGGDATNAVAFAVLFGGGAFGKAACGALGERLGVVRSVVATELLTGLLIAAVTALPLHPALALLPVLGIVLNGTSSVLYGTVPALAPGADTGRAFAVFYTGVIGSGAAAPILFGLVGDHLGRVPGVLSSALAALGTIPVVFRLRHALRHGPRARP